LKRGDVIVAHFLATCALTLLALAVAYFTYQRWQKSKGVWYVLSTVAAVLAVPSFWLSWVQGFLLLVPAVLLFGVGELFKKR